MKKVKMFLFTLLILLPISISARTCTYNDSYLGNGLNNTVILELEDSNNQTNCKAKITLNNGKQKSNNESCQGWSGEVRNTYYLNNECPYYVFMTYSLFSASVEVSYNANTMEELKNKNNNGFILQSTEYHPEEIENSRKNNCNDYTKEECYYGVKDKSGNDCLWNPSNTTCETRDKCSDYTTEATCPEKSSYGRCMWNSTTSKCEKSPYFKCEDYISKGTCPKRDEEGNSCVWDNVEGCIYENNNSNVGSSTDETDDPNYDDPNYNINTTDINNICAMPQYRKPMKFLGIILNFAKIIVPILIILFGAMDLYKAMTSSKDDSWRKALKSIVIRAIAGVFIFLLPGIIQMVLNMVNEWSEYENTWCCCTDCLLNGDCDVNSCSSSSCHIEGTD